ncbi:MAG TPA: VIT domain-containing protein [Gemmatimonadaceae bacterium]|nr:VIT domain-containing protein [Gemmatimonadaceae bacterium]
MRAAFAVLLFVLPSALTAQGRILPRPCPQPVEQCARPGGIERVSSDVRVRLADGVLSYDIEEVFVNRGARVGEADYLFPLPAGAAFQDLALEINGEMVTGETLDAREARRIYEEIVRRQKDPALVEWMGRGLLRTRIFPIAPGERKRVQVRYQMVAQREGDALRVDHFRGTATRPGLDAPRRSEGRTSLTLTYPRVPEYGRAYSPTHDLRLEEQGRLWLAETRGDAREVTILVPVRRGRSAAITVLPHAPGRGDGFALITLAPPALPPRATPRDVTFVLDISGSMRGAKMEQARAAGKQLLATLGPADRFRIIDFASSVGEFRSSWTPATRANIRAAEEYLDALQASGSTNISGALEAALGDREDTDRLALVLFVTDGEPTVGERDPAAIAARATALRRRARVFTFGLGADVNVSLLEQLALGGRGTATFVRPDESTERAVDVVASRLTSPVATSLRMRGEGVRLHGVHPAGPHDLFAGQDLVVLARTTGHGPARIVFEGETADGPVRWETRVSIPERTRDNAFVPRLWATQRVGWLAAEKRANGGSAEIDAEIRDLGERYGIPTEFTSYFVPEPGVLADAQVRGVVGNSARSVPAQAPSAEAVRRERFEQARASAAQRDAQSLSALSLQIAVADSAVSIRQATNRTFVLRDGVWTDGIERAGVRVVKVRPYSSAWFALVERLPELGEAFGLGERVRIAGRQIVLETAVDGVERLTDAELQRIVTNW